MDKFILYAWKSACESLAGETGGSNKRLARSRKDLENEKVVCTRHLQLKIW